MPTRRPTSGKNRRADRRASCESLHRRTTLAATGFTRPQVAHGCMWTMSTRTFDAPGATAPPWSVSSLGSDVALPLLEVRVPTTACAKRHRRSRGGIAIESSSMNATGRAGFGLLALGRRSADLFHLLRRHFVTASCTHSRGHSGRYPRQRRQSGVDCSGVFERSVLDLGTRLGKELRRDQVVGQVVLGLAQLVAARGEISATAAGLGNRRARQQRHQPRQLRCQADAAPWRPEILSCRPLGQPQMREALPVIGKGTPWRPARAAIVHRHGPGVSNSVASSGLTHVAGFDRLLTRTVSGGTCGPVLARGAD